MQSMSPLAARRAIFALVEPDDSPLVRSVTSVWADTRWSPFVGDAHKFGPHITLRGVFPVKDRFLPDRSDQIYDLAGRFAPISLGPSRLVRRYPHGVAVGFEPSADEKSRLQKLVLALAELCREYVQWESVTREEVSTCYEQLSTIKDEKERASRLQIVEQIGQGVVDDSLPPLPATPEYRLSLLVDVWEEPSLRSALFNYGDPFVQQFTPHLSVFTLTADDGDRMSNREVANLLAQYDGLAGRNETIATLYVMKETPDRLVEVRERQPASGRIESVARPGWEVDVAIPLTGA